MKPPPRGRRVGKKGRSVGGARHVRLHLWELQSEAYRSLSVGARALLVEMKALHNGRNNGELFLSVREAARRLGTSKNYADKCLSELRDRGFIQPHVVGAFNLKSGARRGQATSWVLTEFPVGDALGVGTKEFMRWRASPVKNRSTVPMEAQMVPPEGTVTWN
jgi:hypothetical protein